MLDNNNAKKGIIWCIVAFYEWLLSENDDDLIYIKMIFDNMPLTSMYKKKYSINYSDKRIVDVI